MKDFEEFTAQLETDAESNSAHATEQTANEQCMGSYSPKETASAVGISDRTVFKYADILIPLWGESQIREDGLYTSFAIDQMKRIKELKPVRYEKTVRRELGLLEPTQPTPQPSNALAIRHDSTIELATDFDALYEEMATAYFNLDEAETQTTQRLEVLEAEIGQSNQALAQSQQQEDAIAQRAAVMRGIEKAMGEFSAEQKAYAATLNRLRREGKFHASVEEFRS